LISILKIIFSKSDYVFIFLALLVFVFPYYWMTAVAIQPDSLLRSLNTLIPHNVSLINFQSLLRLRYFYRWTFNSIFISLSTSFLVCFFSTLSGYAFAKKDFPGRDFIFWCFLITMAIPRQSILLPLFILIKNLGMINTFQGLILPPLAWPFGIFLMKQVIKTVPNEIIDAGRIDGASEWQIFSRLVVPMVKPGIIALSIFTFVGTYNDYFWQLLVMNKESKMTLPLAVARLQDKYDTNTTLLMAGAVISSLPMIILYLILQKHFIKGIRIGSVKG